MQFEAFLQPVASLLSDTLKPSTPVDTPASSGASAAKQGTKATSTSGSKADKAAAATAAGAGGQPVPLSLQLLLDPGLCDLPWEALSVVRGNCSSVARCLGLAQLQELVCPPQTPGVGVSDDAAASVPAVLDGRQLSYLVDPLCHMSGSMEQPGCYAAPLIPSFRYACMVGPVLAWFHNRTQRCGTQLCMLQIMTCGTEGKLGSSVAPLGWHTNRVADEAVIGCCDPDCNRHGFQALGRFVQ